MSTSYISSPRPLMPLLWVMLFDHTSLNIISPVLTLLFFDIQSSLFAADTSHAVRSMWYGLCIAIPHIVNVVMTPILSGLSDEFGRKKILLVATLGALLFAITAAIGILSGMLSLLFFAYILKGAFSRSNPIAQAAIGDMSDVNNKVRNMGYLQLSISIGAFLGPIMGGYLASPIFFKQLNYALPYFVAALFAGVSCWLMLAIFKETHTIKKKASWSAFNLKTLKKVATNPQVLAISAILLLSQISWSTYYQFIPPILKTSLGFNAHSLGLFVGLIAFWLSLATGFGIKLLQRFFSFKQILFIALYLVLFGLVLSGIFCALKLSGHSLLFVWLAAIPTAAGDVIAYSCLSTLYSNVVEKEEQGQVMGICFIVIALIWSLTALLGGFMMSYSELLPLFFAPIGVLLSIVLLHSSFGKKILFA